MKEEIKEITIDKKKHEIVIKEYETFEELVCHVTGQEILDTYNFRFKQLQAQEAKKKLKPRKIPLREKRAIAFNMMTTEELEKTQQNHSLFEEYLNKYLELVEEKIKKGEIL